MIYKHILKLLGMVSCFFLFTHSAFANVKVFACEPEWAALTREIGQPHVQIKTATHAKQDPHQVEARPSLIAGARRADLLVCTGAELEEGWLPMVLKKASNPKILPGQSGHFLTASVIQLKDKPKSKQFALLGHVHKMGNPHIQLDPRNYLPIAKALTDRLIKIDPKNAKDYQRNYQLFQKKWSGQLQRWSKKGSSLKGLPIVVYHDSWFYLADWLGLDVVATLEPRPGIPPSVSYLNSVLKKVQQRPVRLIIYADYESPKPAVWLQKRIKVPVLKLPSTVRDKEDLSQFFENLINALLSHSVKKIG